MQKALLFSSLIAVIFVSLVTAVIIFFARGYTFSPKSGKISKTGIMVITSEPRDAAIYLDNKLKDTTNTTLNFVTPGKYKVRITKDGFTPWEKEVEVKEELVTRLDVVLFPQVPDLRRLTFVGVSYAFTTPDGTRAVYVATEKTKRGLWVMSLTNGLPFINTDPTQIYKNTGAVDLAKAEYLVSPDSKSLLVIGHDKTTPTYYLLDLGRLNEPIAPIKEANLRPTLLTWLDTYVSREASLKEKLLRSLSDIPWYENPKPNVDSLFTAVTSVIDQAVVVPPSASPENATQPATVSRSLAKAPITPTGMPYPSEPTIPDLIAKTRVVAEQIKWSPKQDKVIFPVGNDLQLYDLPTGRFYRLPKADYISWLPTNTNLILINPNGTKGQIAVSDYDGQNQVVLFSGNFVDSIAIPTVSATKIVVLTNLNQAAGTEPNLYAVVLR